MRRRCRACGHRRKVVRAKDGKGHPVDICSGCFAVHKEPSYIYRSAVTGRFCSKAYARRYPKRTVRERV